MTSKALYHSPLGDIEVVGDDSAVTALRFIPISITSTITNSTPLKETFRWLDIYFSGRSPQFMPPLRPQGTPFQLRVWHELLKIPYGTTTTYGDIARHVGCRSAQAVGQAIGHNPIAIIIPCHRVIGADGSPTGYAYGIEHKMQLLNIERSDRLSSGTNWQ